MNFDLNRLHLKDSGVNPCRRLSHKLAEWKLILKNGIRGNIGLFESIIKCVKIVLCFDIYERFRPYYGWFPYVFKWREM